MHLRRVSRRIDDLRGTPGRTEIEIGRELQSALENACDPGVWDDDPPPGRPDPLLTALARFVVQQRLILQLAGVAELLGGNPIQEGIRKALEDASARMPIAMESHFHGGGPVAVSPDAVTRDVQELLLNTQQEALLRVDLALDRLT
jgi:hypothetical protein